MKSDTPRVSREYAESIRNRTQSRSRYSAVLQDFADADIVRLAESYLELMDERDALEKEVADLRDIHQWTNNPPTVMFKQARTQSWWMTLSDNTNNDAPSPSPKEKCHD